MNDPYGALQLYEDGQWSAALERFEQTLVEQPTSLVALRGVASCYLQLGSPAQALSHFGRAFQVDDENGETSYGLGLTLVVMSQYRQALPYLEHSLQRQPGNPRAWSKKGLVHLQLTQYAEAEACLCKALELSPYDPLDWSNLGVAYLAQGKLDRARPCFYRVLQLDPGFSPAVGYLERLARAMEWNFEVHTGVFRWNGRELAAYRPCDLPAGVYDLESGLELEVEKRGEQVCRLDVRLRNPENPNLDELLTRLVGPLSLDGGPLEHWWGRVEPGPRGAQIFFGTLELDSGRNLPGVGPWELPFEDGSAQRLQATSPILALWSVGGVDRGGLLAITEDGTCYLPRGQRYRLPPGKPQAAALLKEDNGVLLALALELPDGTGRLHQLRQRFS